MKSSCGPTETAEVLMEDLAIILRVVEGARKVFHKASLAMSRDAADDYFYEEALSGFDVLLDMIRDTRAEGPARQIIRNLQKGIELDTSDDSIVRVQGEVAVFQQQLIAAADMIRKMIGRVHHGNKKPVAA